VATFLVEDSSLTASPSFSGILHRQFPVTLRRLQHVSGSVDLTLPIDSGFSFDFSTVSGDLTCTFPSTLDKNTRTDISGKVGDGYGTLQVGTVSGNFSIHPPQ